MNELRWVSNILTAQVAHDLVGVVAGFIVRQLRQLHERVLRKLVTARPLQNP